MDFERLASLSCRPAASSSSAASRTSRPSAAIRMRWIEAPASSAIRPIMLDRLLLAARTFPTPLRRIRFKDPETGKRLVFLTNNFALPALTITELYRLRWQIELFFKWIKQHLRIKAFFGTTENAVKTQIWIAVSVYVLVAIVKKRLKLTRQPLRNPTDPEPDHVRADADRSITSLQPIVGTEAVSPNQLTLFD